MKTTPSESSIPPSSFQSSENDDSGPSESLLGVPIQETDNLDETVLGAAALGHPDMVAPEAVAGTGELTAWDEPVDLSGTWSPGNARDDGPLEAERLVEAGVEEADREKRVASKAMED